MLYRWFIIFVLSINWVSFGMDGDAHETRTILIDIIGLPPEVGSQTPNACQFAICRNATGKVLAVKRFMMPKPRVTIDIPINTTTVEWEPDIAKVSERWIPIAPLSLKDGQERYQVKVEKQTTVKVDVRLKLPAHCTFDRVRLIDTAIPQSETPKWNDKYTELKLTSDGRASFGALPGRSYFLEIKALFHGGHGITVQTPPYRVTDSGTAEIVWEASNWRLMDISFYRMVDGRRELCTDLNHVWITDADTQKCVYDISFQHGQLHLNASDPFSGLNTVKRIRFDLGPLHKYQIIEGAVAECKTGEHTVIVKLRRPETQKVVTVKNDKGETLPAAMLARTKGGRDFGWSECAPRHQLPAGRYDLAFVAAGFKAKRFRDVTIDAKAPAEIVCGALEPGDLVSGVIANGGEIPSAMEGASGPMAGALVYPGMFAAFEAQPVFYDDAATGRFSVRCDLRLRPYLFLLRRRGKGGEFTVVPLTAENAKEPLKVTLGTGTRVGGRLPEALRTLKDGEGKPYNKLAFVRPDVDMFAGGAENIPADGSWEAWLQPGEYRAILCGGAKGIELGKVVVGEKEDVDFVLPVPAGVDKTAPCDLIELLQKGIARPDMSIFR